MKIYKKNLLALCGLTLILGACSNDELRVVEANQDTCKEVSIVLTLKMDGRVELCSRADEDAYTGPRQMLTEQAQQCVNDVRIFVFRSDDPDGDYLFAANEDTEDGSYIGTSEGVFDNKTPWRGERYETHNCEIRPRLETGKYYKFLAVGRDDKYATEINDSIWESTYPWWFGKKTLKDCNFEDGKTDIEEAAIEIKHNSKRGELYEPNYVTEIFSGCLSTEDGYNKEEYIYIDPSQDNFVGTIYMRRAVAGLFAMITDIPCHVTDDETGLEFVPEELNLLLSVCATKTNLKYRRDASEEHFNDVIIGQVPFRSKTVFNPNDWIKDGEANRYLRQGHKYNGGTENYGIDVPPNTTLMSNFIMPVDIALTDDTCEATLVLQYYLARNNGHLIRSQKLNCTIVAVDITGDDRAPVTNIEQKKFSIEANKLYVLCEDFDINKPIHLADYSRYGDTMPSDSGETSESQGDQSGSN